MLPYSSVMYTTAPPRRTRSAPAHGPESRIAAILSTYLPYGASPIILFRVSPGCGWRRTHSSAAAAPRAPRSRGRPRRPAGRNGTYRSSRATRTWLGSGLGFGQGQGQGQGKGQGQGQGQGWSNPSLKASPGLSFSNPSPGLSFSNPSPGLSCASRAPRTGAARVRAP